MILFCLQFITLYNLQVSKTIIKDLFLNRGEISGKKLVIKVTRGCIQIFMLSDFVAGCSQTNLLMV